jgi:hypothetical protein
MSSEHAPHAWAKHSGSWVKKRSNWHQETDGRPGPVVREVGGGRWTYFLLAPGESAEHEWPPGARRFARSAAQAEYVGVPAAEGNTYPLSWRCGAPEVGEFVDAELLPGLLMAQLASHGRHNP